MPEPDDTLDPERAWRENFDAFERMIGKPLEEFMQTEEFADAAAKYLKAQADFRAEIDKGSAPWLEMWNTASAKDLAELRDDLRAVTERLEALEARLGDDRA